MTVAALLALIPALIGLATVQSSGAEPTARRIVVQEQTIMRVPVHRRLAPPAIDWEERKGPKCVPLASVRAAMLSGREQVDFLLDDRRRLRAELSEGCKALDFYGQFYIKTKDERMCAGRDFLHTRMGGSCEIDRFRTLVPQVGD